MDGRMLEEVALHRLEEERRYNDLRVELIRADSIEPQPVSWLWADYLAGGEFQLLAGAPGSGKTTLAMEMAAVISRGGEWPDGTRAPVGKVLIWTGEDSLEHTLIPRLIAASANRSNVHIIHGVSVAERNRVFDPASDLPILQEQIGRLGSVKMVILDPIVSAVTADSHKNTEVRRGLQPVGDLARHTGACVLGISHFSKGTAGRNAVERVTGSLAFAAVARIVLVTAVGQNEPEGQQRALIRAKSNLGPDGGGFGYGVEAMDVAEDISASRIEWQEALVGSVSDLMTQFEGAASAPASNADEVAAWLRAYLSSGPKPAVDVHDQGAGLGYTKKVIRLACKRLGVTHERIGFGRGSHVLWNLLSAH